MGKIPWVLLAVVLIGWHLEHRQERAPKNQPLYEQPYLIVYGRDSCGMTQNTLQSLRSAGIAHRYRSVDDRQVADVLHTRMRRQGIDTRRYMLPVVDLNNRISVQPAPDKLIAQAHKLSLRQAR